MKPQTKDAYQLMHDGILAFSRAERQGIRVDVEYCEKKKAHITRKIERVRKQLQGTKLLNLWEEIYPRKVNLNSNHQLSHLLYKVMKIAPKKSTTSGNQGATDEESLSELGIPELDKILEMRKLTKIRDTYLGSFVREQVNGIMHPFFNLHTVVTFRGSCSNPNFQNIPIRDTYAMKICRNALYTRPGHCWLAVDYSGIEVFMACVAGSTEIETIDGTKTILQIVDSLKKHEKVYVYGYHKEKKRIAVAPITVGGITRRKAEVWKLKLDNGKELIATPDHKVMKRDGTYVQLKDLKCGDSLMPFYKKRMRSNWGTYYDKVYLNNGQNILTHNLISQDVFSQVIAGSNKVVHHWDHNGTNNSLDNIEVMTRKKHMKIHAIQGWENNSESRREGSWTKTEEGRQYCSDMMKERKKIWTDKDWEDFGKRVSEGIARVGGRQKEKNAMWGKTQSEETKEKIARTKRGKKSKYPAWSKGLTKETNLVIAKMAEEHIGRVTSEETKKKISAGNVGCTPWNKDRKGVFHHSEASKQKMIDSKYKYWETRKKKKYKCAICERVFNALIPPAHIIAHGISCKEYKETYNHKVVSIEFCGYQDTYNITVPALGNYAISAGVIIKNCIYTEDPTLIYDAVHGDMHGDMGIELYMLDSLDRSHKGENNFRQGGKNGFVFPEFYGDYWGNCVPNLLSWAKLCSLKDGTPGLVHLSNKGLVKLNKKGQVINSDKFQKHVQNVEDDFWNVRYKVYTKWKKRWWADYQKKGYIEMKTGFRCSTLMDQKQCCNTPFQGSAFHCLLWSFIRIDQIAYEEEKWDSKPIGQIHDEISIDTHPDELEHVAGTVQRVTCVELPSAWKWITVPLEVEADLCPVDEPWASKKPYKLPEV